MYGEGKKHGERSKKQERGAGGMVDIPEMVMVEEYQRGPLSLLLDGLGMLVMSARERGWGRAFLDLWDLDMF